MIDLDWFKKINFNTVKRQAVVIKLMDEKDKVVYEWKLSNAFPKEIAFGELDAMANTFAVEEMVITCEQMEISIPRSSGTRTTGIRDSPTA